MKKGKPKDRFVWSDEDIIVIDDAQDNHKMSEAEKAFFLKQEKK
jgi:hypothetical protein